MGQIENEYQDDRVNYNPINYHINCTWAKHSNYKENTFML